MTIRRLLVANRGEIARRVFRTAKEMGIFTVAVHSEGDADAPFVGDADLGVALGGTTATESYLDSEKVLAAAISVGADAIHPGYGFLSENADFVEEDALIGDLKQSTNDYRTITPLVSLKGNPRRRQVHTAQLSSSEENSFVVKSASANKKPAGLVARVDRRGATGRHPF